jgi:serine/threonine protein kinase
MTIAAAAGLRAGDVIDGKYVVRERLGEGGMGVVFVADQPSLARTVAIKILHPRFAHHRDLVQRFRAEAIAASRVRHPGSVAVVEIGQLRDGTPYIVMEHVRGRSLSCLIADEPIEVARAIALVRQILAVLAATHRDGVVHADVKSDNFIIEERDGVERVKLVDFGLARLAETRHGSTGYAVSGTPEYMAPEVILGQPPHASADLYAVGVILYELLVGATPFAGGLPNEIMARQLDDVAVPPSLRRPERDIPAALDRVVLRALAKLPTERFRDADEFAQALRVAAPPSHAVRARPTRELDAIAPHDTPTRDYESPLPHRRLAHGSDCNRGSSDDIGALRRAIGEALVRGDVARIADGYAKLAASLVRARRTGEARRELVEGLDLLAGARDAAARVRLADALSALERMA